VGGGGEPGRERLLLAARELFAHRGYDGTMVGEIVARAGYTAPALYHHFGSKAGIFVAAAEEVYALVLGRLRGTTAGLTDFAAIVDVVLLTGAEMHTEDPTLAPMLFTVLTEVGRHPVLAKELRPTLRAFRSFFEQVAALAPARLRPDGSTRHLAQALVSLLNGLNSTAVTLPHAEDFPATVAALRALLRAP
jgi:AcrR family transcriptional regulator